MCLIRSIGLFCIEQLCIKSDVSIDVDLEKGDNKGIMKKLRSDGGTKDDSADAITNLIESSHPPPPFFFSRHQLLSSFS